MEDGPDVIVSGRESIITESDVSCEMCVVSDHLPVVVPKLAAVPLAVSVVAQTRPRVGCGPDLPLPVDKGMESLDDDGLDVIISGWESTVMISNVNRNICVEPDQLPGCGVQGGCRAASFTCDRSDEITGWLYTKLLPGLRMTI